MQGFVVKRFCVQRPTSHVYEQHWRQLGQCEERHFYKRTCTYGSDTACQHVDDIVFTTCSCFHLLSRACSAEEMNAHLIGATATSTNDVFFCNERDCHPARVMHKKNGRFSITDYVFFMWSRLKSYDPISLKPHARFPQKRPRIPG